MSDILYDAARKLHDIASIIGWEGVNRLIGDGIGKDGLRGVANAVAALIDEAYHTQIKR